MAVISHWQSKLYKEMHNSSVASFCIKTACPATVFFFFKKRKSCSTQTKWMCNPCSNFKKRAGSSDKIPIFFFKRRLSSFNFRNLFERVARDVQCWPVFSNDGQRWTRKVAINTWEWRIRWLCHWSMSVWTLPTVPKGTAFLYSSGHGFKENIGLDFWELM